MTHLAALPCDAQFLSLIQLSLLQLDDSAEHFNLAAMRRPELPICEVNAHNQAAVLMRLDHSFHLGREGAQSSG
jgi:hypothetical protein